MPAPPAPFIPVPLPDMGFNAMSVPFSPNVMLCAMPATNMASNKVMTTGDEPGVMGGVITGAIKGIGRTLVGNPKIFVNFLPAENLLVPTSGNNFNAPLGAQVVPSLVNVFFTYLPREPVATELPTRQLPKRQLPKRQLPTRQELEAIVHDDWCDDAGSALVVRMLPAGVAWLRLRAFEAGAARKVFNALTALQARGMQALIVDLRGNRGGDAEAALRLASHFLPAGAAMAEGVDSDGDVEPFISVGPARWTMALTLLIDAATASAAELFAAALQHHGRARVVGTRTAGKASAQQVVPRTHGQPAYATSLRYRRPDGSSWQGHGVEPDEMRALTACVETVTLDAHLAADTLLARAWRILAPVVA